MDRSPRLFGSLVGIVSGWAVGTAIYHMLLFGSCSTPPGPGEVACPPEMIQYAGYLMGGIVGGVVGTAIGGSWLAFGALFSGIGLGGVLAGLRPQAEGGQSWFVLFGAMFLLTPVAGVVVTILAGVKRVAAQHVMATGTQAVATVLEVKDTGVTINDNPRVRIRFRIEALHGSPPPFEATRAMTVSRVNVPRVGDQYPVWLSADDERHFVFPPTAEARAVAEASPLRRIVEAAKQGAPPATLPTTDVVRELNTLNELRLSGKISADEFARRTSDIINAPTS